MQPQSDALSNFIQRVVDLFIYPLIGLLFALALAYMLWGGSMFLLRADDPKARETGRQHLIWGVFGFFVMISVIAILSVVTNTFCGSPLCR